VKEVELLSARAATAGNSIPEPRTLTSSGQQKTRRTCAIKDQCASFFDRQIVGFAAEPR
jgi:hypothetical protein